MKQQVLHKSYATTGPSTHRMSTFPVPRMPTGMVIGPMQRDAESISMSVTEADATLHRLNDTAHVQGQKKAELLVPHGSTILCCRALKRGARKSQGRDAILQRRLYPSTEGALQAFSSAGVGHSLGASSRTQHHSWQELHNRLQPLARPVHHLCITFPSEAES